MSDLTSAPANYDFGRWRTLNKKSKLVIKALSDLNLDQLLEGKINALYVACHSSELPDFDNLYHDQRLMVDLVSPVVFLRRINANLASAVATYLNISGPCYTFISPDQGIDQAIRQARIDNSLNYNNYALLILENKKLSSLTISCMTAKEISR